MAASDQDQTEKSLKLAHSAIVWGTPAFEAVFKDELAKQAAQLPLHRALVSGNHVADDPVTVIINSAIENDGLILISAGIFFKGLLLGCSCSDDPSGPNESNEYCEIQVTLNLANAIAMVALVPDA